MKNFTCASSSRLQHVPFSREPSLFPIKIHHNPQGPLGHSKILTWNSCGDEGRGKTPQVHDGNERWWLKCALSSVINIGASSLKVSEILRLADSAGGRTGPSLERSFNFRPLQTGEHKTGTGGEAKAKRSGLTVGLPSLSAPPPRRRCFFSLPACPPQKSLHFADRPTDQPRPRPWPKLNFSFFPSRGRQCDHKILPRLSPRLLLNMSQRGAFLLINSWNCVVDCQLLRANCEHIRALEKTLIIALFHVTEETPKFPNKPINHYNFSAYL